MSSVMNNHNKETSLKIEQKELSPNEIFKKMAINDKEQNKRLSGLYSGNGGSVKGSRDNEQSKRMNIRFYICILGLLAIATSQMSRIVLNQSLPIMVDKSMKKSAGTSTDGSCPAPSSHVNNTNNDSLTTTSSEFITEQQVTQTEPTTTVNDIESALLYTTTDMVPEFRSKRATEEEEEKETSENDNSNNILDEDNHETFLWDNDYQSTLLGGFYYGYFLFMIPGGRIAEIYGAKYVLIVSVAGSAIINFATPWMARNSFTLLVSSRIVLGAIQSGVIPGMYALFNEWLTMSEASIFVPLIKMNLRLGMMFGSGLCGLIKYNWPWTFYTTGILCGILSLMLLFLSTSNPEDNRWVSKSELNHINKKKKRKPKKEVEKSIEDGKQEFELTSRVVANSNTNHIKENNKEIKDKEEGTPWLKLITSPSVIGLIIVKLTFNFAVDFLVILLPKYLNNVFHATPDIVSYITLPMFGIQVALVVFVGWFAKYVIKERPYNLSKTAIRKLFQVAANGGMAIFYILLTFNNCNIIYVAMMFQIISLLSMFTAGGETMLPYDLSDKYPATIMAIANCVANLSGLTTTEISRIVLRGKPSSFDRWNLLIYLTSGANILGCLAFVLLIKAEPLDFSNKKKKKSISTTNEDNNFKSLSTNKTVSTTVEREVKMDTESTNNQMKSVISKEEESINDNNYHTKSNIETETHMTHSVPANETLKTIKNDVTPL